MINPQDIKKFAVDWKERGSEKSDANAFWIELLHAFGIAEPTKFMKFELPIDVEEHKCFIDIWLPTTRVLIENKSRGIDLEKPARQSDGKFLTPFRQALRYADALPYSQRPRRIVICNFDEIRVYDMDQFHRLPSYRPNVILLDRLPHEYSRLNFLIDPNDENVNPAVKISKQAIKLIKLVYDALERQLGIRNAELGIEKPFSNYALRITHYELSRFCVRLMFCLYADDADIFAPKQFARYFKNAEDRQAALIDLFRVLDTPPELRPNELRAELADFPYVNGDLFKDAAESVPGLNAAVNHYIIAAAEFDWIDVSPPIFGAMFESILNPDSRRKGGMHYTSVENIHRLIDPLFLDELHDEFKAARRKSKANRRHALEAFQLKLASLRFFDPACGSGNFLTETYISIRTLENETLAALRALGAPCEVLVSIENFYGIEINNFAVAVARTALWIAENQMLKRTASILEKELDFLPLTSAAHITCGNALRLDWNEVVPDGGDYIISNPPFVGRRYQTPTQRTEIAQLFNYKDIDYVACWFKRAAQFMSATQSRAALVATNSIVQGEQVAAVWKDILSVAHIDFAHRTFKWISDSDDPAAVHCVIIGFSTAPKPKPRIIFDGKDEIIAKNINAYLLDAPDFFIEGRAKPICNVPPMRNGNMPADGKNLIITADQIDDFIRREPRAKKFIRPLLGADEFIKGKRRYCLWLVDATADEIASMPTVAARVEAVRQFRLNSTFKNLIDTPHLFRDRNDPERFIVVPVVSSERRRYIPIGFMSKGTITTTQVQIIPDATLFHFGVLTSLVHMAWMRVVAGRLEMSYRYSATIVYNNFPWCARTSAIEKTAARILEVRKQFGDRSLASLYDDQTMPDELRAAHLENDNAVLDAYGFARDMSESEIVSRLMAMYQELVSSSTTRA